MRRGWDDALDAQVTLADALRTREGLKYMGEFTRSLASGPAWHDDKIEPGEPNPSEERIDRAATVAASAINTVNTADPVWVSEDVCDLVEYAAESPTFKITPLYEDQPFIPRAFVLFERPLHLRDLHDRLIAYRAVSWSMTVERGKEDEGYKGLIVCQWSHMNDPDDFIQKGDLGLVGGSPLMLAHAGYLPFGVSDEGRMAATVEVVATMQALWRLADQRLVKRSSNEVSRPAWKRAKRNWRDIREVQVLTLRRVQYVKDLDSEGEPIDWSHRWIVRGHWRDQAYRTGGELRHKQIWIDSYVKGPSDKPLVLKKHAVEFIR